MTTARDIMHPGAQCVGEDESLQKAAQMMRDLDVGSLPICGKDDRLHGILTDRDIVVRCCADGRDLSQVKAGEMAQGTPHWIDAQSDVDQVLNMMEQHKIRRVPVIADHRLVGMISEADLAQHLNDDQLAHFVETICAGK
ncbi:CBS domain-containing protein [Saccharopolyspora rhizosphaerae]|uniref:CBS domain-containing protein n=1 Tax=Saccharopolyspora rhizosphaerae TaxID=2492662 RepID=A0A3R8R7T6_9PSEU|nr:CBS domain-containing protein [Saccharopolyspora rhizosphaerae]RRO20364.1 CBS domain-containing protein [Saccharopolyspora rhizosphaerae]